MRTHAAPAPQDHRGNAMSPNNPTDFIDRTVEKTHEWLNELSADTGRQDPHKAYAMLRSVLHSLRDRLTIDEAAHLGAQLPMLIRGLYYEGWKPAATPSKIRSREEFLRSVNEKLGGHPEIPPLEAIEGTFRLLSRRITPGEIQNIVRMLPPELRTLWPQEEGGAAEAA